MIQQVVSVKVSKFQLDHVSGHTRYPLLTVFVRVPHRLVRARAPDLAVERSGELQQRFRREVCSAAHLQQPLQHCELIHLQQ